MYSLQSIILQNQHVLWYTKLPKCLRTSFPRKISTFSKYQWFRFLPKADVCGHLLLLDTVLYFETLTTSCVTWGGGKKNIRGVGEGVVPCPSVRSATGGKSSCGCDPSLRKMWRSAETANTSVTGRKQDGRKTNVTVNSIGWFPTLGMFALSRPVEKMLNQLNFILLHWQKRRHEINRINN